MHKRYNPNWVESHRSYSIEKICRLYDASKLHPQTVRAWVRAGNLNAFSRNPILIHGSELKRFLKENSCANKMKGNFNEMVCFKCKTNVPLKDNTVLLYYQKNGSIKAVGECEICGCEISRFYKKIHENLLLSTFTIQQHMLTICNSPVEGRSAQMEHESLAGQLSDQKATGNNNKITK